MSTALREEDGTFVPIPREMWKFAFPYAKRNTVPIGNLVELSYQCPNAGLHCTIIREFCDRGVYKELVVKFAKTAAKSSPHLVSLTRKCHSLTRNYNPGKKIVLF